VLAAGGSSRLGRPKQLLDYQGRPLLDTTLDMARRCGFDQLIVALGGAGDDVRSTVDLSACDVVDNVHFTTGCSSSIVAALAAIDERAGALVLLLGDQPGVEPSSVDALRTTAESADASLAVCRYEDGRGHPFWFARSLFADLADLHGDKAVWKLLESGRYTVVETAIDGPVPIDVDTWADYERLLESS
jgi:molybdenum cofactor cytidylyltransferase